MGKETKIVSAEKRKEPLEWSRRVFHQYCESTSMHGYPYLYISDNVALRIAWILVIFLFTGIGIGFLIANTKEYINSRLVTTIESSSAPLDVNNLQQSIQMIDKIILILCTLCPNINCIFSRACYLLKNCLIFKSPSLDNH